MFNLRSLNCVYRLNIQNNASWDIGKIKKKKKKERKRY